MDKIELSMENTLPQLNNTSTIRKTVAKQICIHKIKLLQCIENASAKYETYSEEWIEYIKAKLNNNFPQYSYFDSKTPTNMEIKVGHYCHAISFKFLMFLFLKIEDFNAMKWFIENEVNLFVYRYLSLSEESRRNFLILNDICSSSVETNAKKLFNSNEIYKVDWKNVLELVAKRKVPILNGNAYIDKSHIPHVIASKKTKIFNEMMEKNKIFLVATLTDPRICDLIEDLERYAKKNINNRNWSRLIDEDEVNKKSILESSVHFPPCMRNIVNHIEDNNHLKHNGRLQFIPFLKEIGLSIDNAIDYFKTQFCQRMTEEEFARKRYEYFIKHQYGLTGNYIDFNSFNCMKMNKLSGIDDCSGCPFSSKKSALKIESLKNLTAKNKQQILDLVDKGLFTQACTYEYSLTHKKSLRKEIINPIEYYVYSAMERKKYTD